MDEKKKRIRHPGHDHELDLCEKGGEVACQDCGEIVHGWAYGCGHVGCSFFLHDSCIAVQSPLHPQHPLEPGNPILARCHVCYDFEMAMPIFSCRPCGFHLCCGCVKLVPILEYEHKGHPFFLIDTKKYDWKELRCMIGDCPDRYRVRKGPFDLPESIHNRPCHWLHSVTYADKYVEPHIIGCFCDGCEEERDPEAPVYRCEECNFSAHAACALSEVLPELVAVWEALSGSRVVETSSADPSLDELNKKIKGLRSGIGTDQDILDHLTKKLTIAEGIYERYVASTASNNVASTTSNKNED